VRGEAASAKHDWSRSSSGALPSEGSSAIPTRPGLWEAGPAVTLSGALAQASWSRPEQQPEARQRGYGEPGSRRAPPSEQSSPFQRSPLTSRRRVMHRARTMPRTPRPANAASATRFRDRPLCFEGASASSSQSRICTGPDGTTLAHLASLTASVAELPVMIVMTYESKATRSATRAGDARRGDAG
jgi:hypothetical protein